MTADFSGIVTLPEMVRNVCFEALLPLFILAVQSGKQLMRIEQVLFGVD